jgi:hypothetical protein
LYNEAAADKLLREELYPISKLKVVKEKGLMRHNPVVAINPRNCTIIFQTLESGHLIGNRLNSE